MAEYIEREAFVHRLMAKAVTDDLYGMGMKMGFTIAAETALRMPYREIHAVDVVEVVRCKDCKHLMFSDCYGECSAAYRGIVRPDDTCPHGVRRGEDE